jgi:hypothetical protein
MVDYVPLTSLLAGNNNVVYPSNLLLATASGGNVVVNNNVTLDSTGNLVVQSFSTSTKITAGAGNVYINSLGYGVVFPDGTFQTTAATNTPPGGTNGAIQYNNNGVFGGDVNKFYIDTNGNVGIGTSTVSSRILYFFRSQDTGTKVAIANPNTGTNAFTQFSLDSAGNSTYLYGFGSGYTTSGRYITGGSVLETTGTGGLGLSAFNATGNVMIYTGSSGTERMRVDSNGNVGIGTTSPTARLHVSGTITIKTGTTKAYNQLVDLASVGASGYYAAYDSLGTFIGYTGYYSSIAYYAGMTVSTTDLILGTNSSPRFIIDGTSGNVGIGTFANISSKLSVYGGNVGIGSSGYGIVFPDGTFQTTAADMTIPGGTTGAIQFNNSGSFGGDTTKFYLNPTTGNVGIGTTSPVASLQVQGTTKFTGHMAFGSNATIDTVNANTYWNAYNEPTTVMIQDYISGNLSLYNGGVSSLGQFNEYRHTGVAGSAYIYDTYASPVIVPSSSGNISYYSGRIEASINKGSGNITNWSGLESGPVHTGSGTVTSLAGISSYPYIQGPAGNITTAYSVLVTPPNIYTSGNIATNYGISVLSPTIRGKVGTHYGVYIGDQTNSNITAQTYNFYSAGATSKNIFDGNVGIGNATVTTGYKLEVYGQDARINTITVGIGSGSNNSTNTALGYQVLQSNTYGYDHTAVGYQALYSATNGAKNLAIGYQALYSATSGSNNQATGYKALYQNTTGSFNHADGYYALINNTTGQYNMAIGTLAMLSNQTGSYNQACGYRALQSTTGSYNQAYGYNALQLNSTGYGNQADGYKSLKWNTTGNLNSAFGFLSGNAITTGSNNTVIGPFAGSNITVGSNNTVLGAYTGLTAPISKTGSNWVVLSDGAGTVRQVIDPNGNVGIGTSTVSYKLQVNGSFAATTKSFVIDHPSNPGMKLRYGSLESPYHGVRLTGEGEIQNGLVTIKLPNYISALCKHEGTQVQLTNIRHGKVLWIEDIDIDQNQFTVASDTDYLDNKTYKFYWSFTGIRKDIGDLLVEYYETV